MRHWTWRYLGAGTEPSGRSFPGNNFRELEFSPTDVLRKVQKRCGWFSVPGTGMAESAKRSVESVSECVRRWKKACGKCGSDGNVWVQSINVRMRSIGGWSADCRGTRPRRRVGADRTPFAPLTASVLPPTSLMSMCYPCVRTPVTLDSGPNTRERGRGGGGWRVPVTSSGERTGRTGLPTCPEIILGLHCVPCSVRSQSDSDSAQPPRNPTELRIESAAFRIRIWLNQTVCPNPSFRFRNVFFP